MTQLEDKLKTLSPVVVGVFCLLAVERSSFIYKVFAEKFSGSSENFYTILDQAFELVFSRNKSQLDGLKKELEALIPDTEVYSDVLADQAQCSTICLMYSLEYIASKDVSMAFFALQKIAESIEIYEYENDKKKVIQEEEWQKELLIKINHLPEVLKQELETIRKLNREYMLSVV